MRYLFYTIVPLLVLLAALSLACIVGYFICAWHRRFYIFDNNKQIGTAILVLSIFPAMVYLKSQKRAGVSTKIGFFKQLLQGFGLGFITLMPVFIVLYMLRIN